MIQALESKHEKMDAKIDVLNEKIDRLLAR